MVSQIEPGQLFGSKLALTLGPAGKDKIRYIMTYRIKPVKELMCRFGVAHKNCVRRHIVKKDSIMIIKIDCGLFGLDKSGMLRYGQSDEFTAPTAFDLKFDGFRGIELEPEIRGVTYKNKYRVWRVNPKTKSWELAPEERYDYVDSAGARQTKVRENLHTFYPYKEALLPLPKEILHDDGTILVPATEAVAWMVKWIERVESKNIVLDAPGITMDNMGVQAVTK